ncbi:MAG: hypothetical protein IID54_06710 [Proteobacteria bacterium]|nr:hypothetical protein [Pseudomonadota bacterium]
MSSRNRQQLLDRGESKLCRPRSRKSASAINDIVAFIELQPLTPPVDWAGYFTAWGEHHHRAGVIIIISDFWATDILPALAPLGSTNWRGNFYKCGDKTSHPHWGMWSPITNRLSFHQPALFGDLVFAPSV